MPKRQDAPKRDLGQELLDAIDDIKAYKRGEIRLRVWREVPIAPPGEIRARLGLSQQRFAARLGVSVRTLQEWEQGRRAPRGPAKALLRIADQQPEVFDKLRYTMLVEGQDEQQTPESDQAVLVEPAK
jgi:putative transcriptional regulator